MTSINIEGLPKASVLAALYNNAKPQGMGFLQYIPGDMSIEEAQCFINAGRFHFDYLFGRVMKVNITGDSFTPAGYDMDNGAGSAAHVINKLKESI